MTRPPAGPDLAGWRRAVLSYGRRSLRPLPWRATRDPWAVLVSEFMLQQTQAARVVAPYLAFLDRFPTPAAAAAAGPGAVVGQWAGLGYNRRALSLHRAAQDVTERFGGSVPDDLASLRSLPGVGPYTARAVLAFAFERPVGVVDVNVARADGAGSQGVHETAPSARARWRPPAGGPTTPSAPGEWPTVWWPTGCRAGHAVARSCSRETRHR